MVIVDYGSLFEKKIKKLKNFGDKERVKKQITRIVQDPEIGKPMRYIRKGTREVYISPFRLSYIYYRDENKVIFLDLYHKDEQ